MNNDGIDGGYDDDTDVEDEVVIVGDSDNADEDENSNSQHENENVGDENAEIPENVIDQGQEGQGQQMDTNDIGSSPPRKVAKLDLNSNNDQNPSTSGGGAVPDDADSDGFTCTICMEPFTNSGDHRICCLKCGHIFGKHCIEKWLKSNARCPQCNCKSRKGDIRVLYVKSLQAVDNTEVTSARKDLESAQITISKYTLETAKLKITIDSLNQQIRALDQKNVQLRLIATNASKTQSTCSCDLTSSNSSNPVASSSHHSSSLHPSANFDKNNINNMPTPSGRKQLNFSFAKFCEIKEGICRVGAYNEGMNLMVVSHEMRNSLYPNGCGGIKQINMLEVRPTVSFPIHQKQIRDMQFCQCQNDVLLSVALDKKAILFNCNGNVTVQTFNCDYPLWSCVWDEVRPHIFYVGASNGQIIAYDIRSPQEPLATHSIRGATSPVGRLKFVRPSYQSSSFPLSGLLIQQLTTVSFGEQRDGNNTEMRFHQLPVEGPFVNLDFEPVSRHVLISARPSRTDVSSFHSSHLLCDLTQHLDETLQTNVVSSNLVRIYQGSNREVNKLCRSSIFSPPGAENGYVYLMANGVQNAVKCWDISLPETCYKNIPNAPEFVLDYVHGRVNSNNFLTLISEKGVRVFNQNLV